MDLKTNRIIISRHVIFDESTFPKAKHDSQISQSYNFLDYADSPSPLFKMILETSQAPRPLSTQTTAPLVLPPQVSTAQTQQNPQSP